jgi:hypothetical protein
MSEKKLVIAVTEEEIKAAIVAKANEYKEIFTGSKLIIVPTTFCLEASMEY